MPGCFLNCIYNIEGKSRYFGSITAIYDIFTPETLGVKKNTLWTYGITEEKPYKNRKCAIYTGTIHRKKTKRHLQILKNKIKDFAIFVSSLDADRLVKINRTGSCYASDGSNQPRF